MTMDATTILFLLFLAAMITMHLGGHGHGSGGHGHGSSGHGHGCGGGRGDRTAEPVEQPATGHDESAHARDPAKHGRHAPA